MTQKKKHFSNQKEQIFKLPKIKIQVNRKQNKKGKDSQNCDSPSPPHLAIISIPSASPAALLWPYLAPSTQGIKSSFTPTNQRPVQEKESLTGLALCTVDQGNAPEASLKDAEIVTEKHDQQ